MGRVDQHVVHRPLHVSAKHGAKFGVLGQPGVVGGTDEAVHESPAQIAHVSVACVHVLQPALVAARLRVPRRPAHDLGPVSGQPLNVLRVLAGMGERVVQLGILQAPRMVRGGQGQESGLASGELE